MKNTADLFNATTVADEAYALTESGLDLVFRGMMRSMSDDPEKCHSCLKSYKQMYFVVVSSEQIYN